MPVTLDWRQIAVRLALTCVAGIIIGFNRGEHGRPAGMRTTLLVCLAASIAMIQANLLMNSVGKTSDSFVVLDLMRLPLGILSGMGFIGAGTILRKGNLIVGVTTAATLWFTTVMGLCFGGGQIGLGLSALALGLGTVWGLTYVESAMRQDTRVAVIISLWKNRPSEQEIREKITEGGCVIKDWGVTYAEQGQRREIRAEVQWRKLSKDTQPPAFVSQLAEWDSVERIHWQPNGSSENQGGGQTKPTGLPTAMSEPK